MNAIVAFFRTIFVSPDEPRLRAGWRLLFHFALLGLTTAFIGFLTQLFTIFVGNLSIPALSSLISLIAITLSVLIARRLLDRRSFRSLGLRWDAQALRDLWVGILIPAILFALIFATEWAFGWLDFSGPVTMNTNIASQLGIWLLVFLMVGWYEELLSRGYWLRNLAEGLNLPLAVFISSAVFSLAHLGNPSASIFSVLGILAAGYFLAYPVLRTGQLWMAVGLHIGWNIFEGPVFGFPVSGLDTPGLLLHSATGPEWLTGGPFGPEAGFILFPALALGAYLINLYTQGRTPLDTSQ
jgi:hypothetical protein